MRQPYGKASKSLINNDTRDTRDTFGVNSINNNMESTESQVVNSGVFKGLNTDSTIENQKLEFASGDLANRTSFGQASPDAS